MRVVFNIFKIKNFFTFRYFCSNKIKTNRKTMFKLLKYNQKLVTPIVRNQLACFSYTAKNEPLLDYKQGSEERIKLNEKLLQFLSLNFADKTEPLFDIPIVIGDKEIRTGNAQYQVAPFDHKLKLARFYHADRKLIDEAIENSMSVRAEWEGQPAEHRAQILLKAADAIANEKRMEVMAATMLGQGKTVYQAEIDSAAELVDFLRCNVQFLAEMLKYKPLDDGDHTTNDIILRGMSIKLL